MAITPRALCTRLSRESGLPTNWKPRRDTVLQLLDALAAWGDSSTDEEVILGFVPGRIEVFGRHTDYAGGRTLVCSIDKGFLFAAVPGRGRRVRIREDSSEFGPVEFELEPDLAPPAGEWANYPMTMARRLARNFTGHLRGVDICFSSAMPVGSGMSGSSALMMMAFTALACANRLHENAAFRANIRSAMDLSVYLACAENGQSFGALEGDSGVGTFGGSEDHAAILNGRPGRLSLFGFGPPELQDEVPWPRGWRMVVAFSGVKAEKTREALEKYNLVSRRARDSVLRFNQAAGTRLSTLREVVDCEPKPKGRGWLRALDDRAEPGAGPAAPALADRVRQFMLEDRTHIPGALAALKARDLPAFGKFVSASHRASKKYLWNIVPEIDYLQGSACRLGAAGASGFGAGFGGSIFAVTTAAYAEDLLVRWRERYAARYPGPAAESSFFIAHPGPGIEVWTKSGPTRFADLVFQA
ncbi:MAG: galactokinase family protein [Spirochaetia bacterium]